MDSKWGLPVLVALAGFGLWFMKGEPRKKVMESELIAHGTYRDNLLRGSQAQLIYLNQFPFDDTMMDEIGQNEMRRNLIKQLRTAGWLEKSPEGQFQYRYEKKGKPKISPKLAFIPSRRLNTWESYVGAYGNIELKEWCSGGPLNEIHHREKMGNKSLMAMEILKQNQYRTKGDYWKAWKNLAGTGALPGDTPEMQYFHLEGMASALYFAQFSFGNLHELKVKGKKNGLNGNPFDYNACLKWIESLYIHHSWEGYQMEKRARDYFGIDKMGVGMLGEAILTSAKSDKQGLDIVLVEHRQAKGRDGSRLRSAIQVKPLSYFGRFDEEGNWKMNFWRTRDFTKMRESFKNKSKKAFNYWVFANDRRKTPKINVQTLVYDSTSPTTIQEGFEWLNLDAVKRRIENKEKDPLMKEDFANLDYYFFTDQ